MVILMNGPVLSRDHSIRVEVAGKHRVVMSFPPREVVIASNRALSPIWTLTANRHAPSFLGKRSTNQNEISPHDLRRAMELSIETVYIS